MVVMELVGVAVVLGHQGIGVRGGGGVLMLLVVPGSLAPRERRSLCGVRVVVPGRAAWLECRGTAVVVGVRVSVAVGVLRGLGSGVVRRGWAWVPVGPPHASGGRTGGPCGPSWSSWLGGCWGQVIQHVSFGDGAPVCQRCASLRDAWRPLV